MVIVATSSAPSLIGHVADSISFFGILFGYSLFHDKMLISQREVREIADIA